MTLKNAPTPFNGVVLAVVRRVVGESNVDLVLLHELHDARQELASAPAVLGTIVLQQDKGVDLRKAGRVLDPQRFEPVDDAIAGDLGRADGDRQFVVLGKQETYGSHLAVRRVIVIERSNWHATLAATRKLTDLDGRLRVARNQQLVFGPLSFLADACELFEDGVGLWDLFFTWVFCTRTG